MILHVVGPDMLQKYAVNRVDNLHTTQFNVRRLHRLYSRWRWLVKAEKETISFMPPRKSISCVRATLYG